MSLRMKVFKGSMLLSAGQAVSQGCSFIRNIILARILTKDDFGLAATFAITISMFELVNRLGLSTQIVQSKDGDDPSFQATAHTFQLLAGFVSALLIYVSAPLVAGFFNAPEAQWAFQLLAVIPLTQAFGHLDVSRVTRTMRYGPLVIVDAVPQILITAGAFPLAIVLKDYRVILWLLIAKWVLSAVGSHLYAERGFRLGWDKRFFKSIVDFSWPLLINGIFMFGVLQGDRFLVGHFYTKADLASYSIAAQLTLVPGMMLVAVVGSIMMPILSAEQGNDSEFRRKYGICIQALTVFSALYAIFLIVGGEKLVVAIFGEKYTGTGLILGWLVSANSFRIVRAAPAIASSAKSDTKNQLISNILRAVGLILGIVAALFKQSLATVAACGLIGETLASGVSSFRLSMVNRLPLRDSFLPMGVLFLFIALSGFLVFLGVPHWNWMLVITVLAALSVGLIGTSMVLLKQFRMEVLSAASFILAKISIVFAREK